jgi:hypothetical protein
MRPIERDRRFRRESCVPKTDTGSNHRSGVESATDVADVDVDQGSVPVSRQHVQVASRRSTMSSPDVEPVRGSVLNAFSLAHLLEHIERSGGSVDAESYRNVVFRLKEALSGSIPEVALTAVLRTYPSAAEIYENMTYETEGLSRSSIERNVSSEVLATQAIERFSHGPH